MKLIRKIEANGFNSMNIREFNDIDITPCWEGESDCEAKDCVLICVELNIVRKKSMETILRVDYKVNRDVNKVKLVYENYKKICNKLLTQDYCEIEEFFINEELGEEVDVW